MKYIYQARSKEGKLETGAVEATSKEAAVLLLQKYNIFVTSLKEETPAILRGGNITLFERVSKKDLAIFSRQLAVMMQSRVPVTKSLKSLAGQTKKQGFRDKILKISQLVEEGNSLSSALSAFPKVFSLFFVSLVKTGEASGKISETLYFLSEHMEREYDISAQIRDAMIYPAFVISALGGMLLVMIFFLMPRLLEVMKTAAVNPPPLTMMMINGYDFFMRYGWIIIVVFLAAITLLVYYLFMTKEGKKAYDKLSLKIPLLNGFLKKIFLIRFAENISTLLTAGLSINNALNITKDTVDNFVYKQIISETEQGVSEGQKMSAVLAKYPAYIPAFVVEMMQVGEETGTLDKNLMEIVNFYQKEVERAVKTFTALLEPILIIFLGVVVALMAVFVLQPLYGILGSI